VRSSNAARKEAIRMFKEQKPLRGAFAVRCTATGRVWAGSSGNLDAARNRFWFCLRNGSHPDKALQNEWNATANTHSSTRFWRSSTTTCLPSKSRTFSKRRGVIGSCSWAHCQFDSPFLSRDRKGAVVTNFG
jgi:hypothetical protein